MPPSDRPPRDPQAHPKLGVLDDRTRSVLAEALDTLALGEALAALPADGSDLQAATVRALDPSGFPGSDIGLGFLFSRVPATGGLALEAGRSVLCLTCAEQGLLLLGRSEAGDVMQLIRTDPQFGHAWKPLTTQADLVLGPDGVNRWVGVPFIPADPNWPRLMPQWLDHTQLGWIDPAWYWLAGGLVLAMLFRVFLPSVLLLLPPLLGHVLGALGVLVSGLVMLFGLLCNSGTRSGFRALAAGLALDRAARLSRLNALRN